MKLSCYAFGEFKLERKCHDIQSHDNQFDLLLAKAELFFTAEIHHFSQHVGCDTAPITSFKWVLFKFLLALALLS